MQTDQGPAHNILVGNSFTEVVGKEHLKLYKVRPESVSTFFVANCCKSMMFFENPVLLGNEAAISINTAHFKSPVFELKPEDMMCRWYT